MTFGQGGANFLVDSPAAVAQCVVTRLRLWEGEWYLALDEGTPYFQDVLGQYNPGLAAAVVQDRIVNTPFVTGLNNFNFNYNSETRVLQTSGEIITAFGPSINFTIPLSPSGGGQFQIGVTPLGDGGGLG